MNQAETNGAESKPRIDWADPNVPVGNSPPMSLWPAFLAALAWVAFVAFLVVMTIHRVSSHGV